MKDRYESILDNLKQNNNFRYIKQSEDINALNKAIDLSSNDYLGIAANKVLAVDFLNKYRNPEMASTASRLLSLRQLEYTGLEKLLESLYKKEVILFNSGYHANLGTISALGGKGVLIVADKLVHASIIDGIVLSRSTFIRYRHNDYDHLCSILEKEKNNYEVILIVTESVFSMDGDMCDIPRLVEIKNKYDNALLYVDEAHAFGVFGTQGLGLCEKYELIDSVDFIIGTLGKAAASYGAFVVTSSKFKQYLINSARSFIFSTAIPPINCAWSRYIIEKIVDMKTERDNLNHISMVLRSFVNPINGTIQSNSQIIPIVVGDSIKAIKLSEQLKNLGYIALPIRTPTVPQGTERVRISLNALLQEDTVINLINSLKQII